MNSIPRDAVMETLKVIRKIFIMTESLQKRKSLIINVITTNWTAHRYQHFVIKMKSKRNAL